jgi:anti-sigma B factor antagonist
VAGLSLLLISVVPDRERVTIIVAGEVDLCTASEIEAQLEELWLSGWTAVDVDLRQVSFMDTSGLHALTRAMHAAQTLGTTLTIVDGSDPVRRLLSLTRMDDVLPICSRAEAA